MRRTGVLFAAAAFACGTLAPTEARAADHAQIGCPLGGISEPQRLALGEAMREHAGFSDPRVMPLRRAASACAQRWHWSDRTFNYAVRFHCALAGQRALRRWLVAAGADVGEIGGMARQDEALIASLASLPADSPPSAFEGVFAEAARTRYAAPLERALRGLGSVSREVYGDMAEATGRYIGMVVATESLRRLFTAS